MRTAVIPAQAWIQFETCEKYVPKIDHLKSQWVPACAEMTWTFEVMVSAAFPAMGRRVHERKST